MEAPQKSEKLFLELGDIILIHSSTNDVWNQHVFYIDYIDTTQIIAIRESDLLSEKILVSRLQREATQIDLLYRNPKRGYIRQHQLVMGEWLDIHFGGELPAILTGRVTNIMEDVLELTTYPDKEVIYLPFDYKGIPLNLPIVKIQKRPAPGAVMGKSKEEEEGVEKGEEERVEKGVEDLGEEEGEGEEVPVVDVVMGEYLEQIKEYVPVNKANMRYELSLQINNLMEELLNEYPLNERTPDILTLVHTKIKNFIYLRQVSSEWDDQMNCLGARPVDRYVKPLAGVVASGKLSSVWLRLVAKNIKKLYFTRNEIAENEDELTSEENVNIRTTADLLQTLENYRVEYESNQVNGDYIRYVEYQKNIFSELSAYLTLPVFSSAIIPASPVTCMLNNDENMYSYAIHLPSPRLPTTNFIGKTRFLEQVYLPETRLVKSIKPPAYLSLHSAESIDLHSILTLPLPIIEYSRIQLPFTLLWERVNLSQTPLPMLPTSLPVQPIPIEHHVMNFVYPTGTFFNNTKHFYVDLDMQPSAEQLLKNILPSMDSLVDQLDGGWGGWGGWGGVSFHQVMRIFELFYYTTSDLIHPIYQQIQKHVRKNILVFHKQFQENSKEFQLLHSIPKIEKKVSILLNNLSNNEDQVKDKYDFQVQGGTPPPTTTEVMATMLRMDNAELYNTAISLSNIALIYPKQLAELLDTDKEKITKLFDAGAGCETVVIAKRYTSFPELQADNKKVIYFDKEYDTTPYALMENFQKEQIELNPDELRKVLVNKLQTKYSYSVEDSEYLAETLVLGRKPVRIGQYAVLDPGNGGDFDYFLRTPEQIWKKDGNSARFGNMVNTDALCLIQPKCQPAEGIAKCVSLESSKKDLLNKLLGNLDKAYHITQEEWKTRLQKYFDKNVAQFDKLQRITEFIKTRANYQQYQLGWMYLQSLEGEGQKPQLSPYATLRDLILAQTDPSKRNQDVLLFAKRFTRDAVPIVENIYWKYCLETGVPLLPVFLVTMAGVVDQDRQKVLNELIQTQGMLSQDGQFWVCKYTGYVITLLNWDTEEGYEEGFKKVSRQVMELDMMQSLQQLLVRPVSNEPELTRAIRRILEIMLHDMSVFLPISSEELVIRVVSSTLINVLPNKEKYEKAREKHPEKIPEYSVVYHKTLLTLTIGMLMIAAQTCVPPVRPRKTYPGCVASLEGFPLTEGDTRMMDYVVCILYKLTKSTNQLPWSVLAKLKKQEIANQLTNFITTYLLPLPEIKNHIQIRLDYHALPVEDADANTGASAGTKHGLFLPPQLPIHISEVDRQSLADDWLTVFKRDLSQARPVQHPKVGVLESKIRLFSFSILENIQSILKKKQSLFQSVHHVPFIDNACCNDKIGGGGGGCLRYFVDIRPEIGDILKHILYLSDILEDVEVLSESEIWQSVLNTKRIYPSIPSEWADVLYYQTCVHYGNFNNNLPIPKYLQPIIHHKPELTGTDLSLPEIITQLKQQGIHYTQETFLRVLQLIARQHGARMPSPLPPSTPPSTAHATGPASLHAFLVNYPKQGETPAFRNFILEENKRMMEHILDFLREHTSISLKEVNLNTKELDAMTNPTKKEIKVLKFIRQYTQWTRPSGSFYQNVLYEMVARYPSMLLHKEEEHFRYQTYWDYSPNHVEDLNKKMLEYYLPIKSFFQDVEISKVLYQLPWKVDLPAFSMLPLPSDSGSPPALTPLYDLIQQNLFYSVLETYIELSSSPHSILSDTELNTEREELFLGWKTTLEPITQITKQPRTIHQEVLSGNQYTLKTKIAELLMGMIQIFYHEKEIVNQSYDAIQDKIYAFTEGERATITDRLKSLTPEARAIDIQMKMLKLGVWAKKKGLVEYDKATFDEEKIKMEHIASMLEEQEQDAEELDAIATAENADALQEINAEKEVEEEFGIQHLHEDYEDGYDIYDVDEERDAFDYE